MVQFFFDRAENIVGKGEKAFFSILLQCFQKPFLENQELSGQGLHKESELYKFFFFFSNSRADNSRHLFLRPNFA